MIIAQNKLKKCHGKLVYDSDFYKFAQQRSIEADNDHSSKQIEEMPWKIGTMLKSTFLSANHCIHKNMRLLVINYS
jgi:hypothetical protein